MTAPRLTIALLALCALAGPALGSSLEPGSGGRDELYLDAMQALSGGRAEDAALLLTGFLEKEPLHAGAWLDLALSQCELGNAGEAERLFREIEARFAPPPGIVEVIQNHRARGCKRPPAQRALMSLSLGRGYDDNVNQGASSHLFSTGSGATLTQWELAPDYLPRADGYVTLAGDYARTIAAQTGTRAFAQLRQRRHDSLRQQDTTSLLPRLLDAEQPWQLGGWRGRATAAFGNLRLEHRLYQRQSLLQMRLTPPVALPARLDWGLSTSVNRVSYPSRNGYNSNTIDLGTTLTHHGAGFDTTLALGTLSDNGQSARPGGNRTGRYAGVLLQGRLGERATGELGWNAQSWRSGAPYAPGLIDAVRYQNNQQLRAALTWQVAPHHSVQLEWRAVRNRENISLFQYKSQALQFSWRWDNF
ncbi:MAG: tetratricopeptide repeat protein [Burkholderiaceae bacterium]|nr:tetratricopeptide repeat protein [Burkholderiaceae bacterium]